MPHAIEVTFMTRYAKKEDVFSQQTPVIPVGMPFEFKSLQFRIRLVFTMSIDKAQGRSRKIPGTNSGNPCFSCGQMYVARRVGTGRNLYVFASDSKMKNLFFQTALE